MAPTTIPDLIMAWSGRSVLVQYDKPTASWMFIALHDPTAKQCVGGVRMKVYPCPEDGLRDALRLAEGMTYKWAAIDVEFGGGKAVIALSRPVAGAERQGLLERFAAMANSLNGRYGSGPDLGITQEDVDFIAKRTRYMHCYDHTRRVPIDPGPYTAYGAFVGMKAALRHTTGTDNLRDRVVLVQGLGDTGLPLCNLLHEAGAALRVTDIDGGRAKAVVAELGGEVVAPDAAYDAPCDIYAPCAIGATLNEDTIPRLKAKIIAGTANNQLAVPEDGERLLQRGILYCPDYVVNGGGAVSLAMFDEGKSVAEVRTSVEAMDRRLTAIFQEAAANHESPVHAARRKAELRIAKRHAAA